MILKLQLMQKIVKTKKANTSNTGKNSNSSMKKT